MTLHRMLTLKYPSSHKSHQVGFFPKHNDFWGAVWFIVCPVLFFLCFTEYLISRGPSVTVPFETSSGSLWQLPGFMPWYHYLQQVSAAWACSSLILRSHKRQWSLPACSLPRLLFFVCRGQTVCATCNLCQKKLTLNCCSVSVCMVDLSLYQLMCSTAGLGNWCFSVRCAEATGTWS